MFQLMLRNYSETVLAKLKLSEADRNALRRELAEVRIEKVPEGRPEKVRAARAPEG